MGFIERELERIGEALRERRKSLPQDSGEQGLGRDYYELYAAQQALSWALDPDGSERPSIWLRALRQTQKIAGR